jgi:DNA processing protein
MTIFGIHESEIDPLIRAVTFNGELLGRAEIRDRFAASVWTGAVEPGDEVAGRLIYDADSADVLEAILNGYEAEQLVAFASRRDLEHERVSIGEARTLAVQVRGRSNSVLGLLALREAARFGAKLLIPGDELWPTGLGDLGFAAPHALWVRGNREALVSLSEKAVSIVGARAATGYGENLAHELTSKLVDRGYTIVSGAAYGIDGEAHRSALMAGGTTVAFLAGGVDRFYPAGHDTLIQRIVEKGAVIGEMPPGTAPTRWRFLARNRLIAATTPGTVVVEAGFVSGSLSTARHAIKLGRTVMAVPGPVTSAASAGCHRLIQSRQAALVTSAEEVDTMLQGTFVAPSFDLKEEEK